MAGLTEDDPEHSFLDCLSLFTFILGLDMLRDRGHRL